MLRLRDIRQMTGRELVVQGLVLGLAVVLVLGAIGSARTNLAEQGLTSGFNFLARDTGWSYSFSLIERTIDDTYARTLTIGFMNTLFVGFTAIVFATVLGFLIGTLRDNQNPSLQVLAALYIQIFRNIPLILQIVFLYSILIHLPSPKNAHSMFDMFYWSNRGVMVPVLNISLNVVLVCVLALFAGGVVLARFAGSVLRAFGAWLVLAVLVLTFAVVLFGSDEGGILSVPELKGLRFRGGLTLSVELVAMIVGIVLYGAAYIGEVVRGGLDEVPKGLVEAGRSLGMRELAIWWKIKVPMALRSIVPPLGNQWIFIMKATTIGVAIGFSDLFYIVSTSITQSGQTLELIFILASGFLLVNFTMAQGINWLNRRLALKGYGS